ncbi:MAG: methylmalonyl-CoA mutase family protein, partial [Myxococcales bacterium]|nr:methylmalonyl-CoA mutase family protein [Myxococcales bacterium]
RFVTAASLFDGHDAAINIMRRILQAEGAEVIHLGHDRSVAEIVDAAVQEDAHGIAVSSYQGGHMEYFTYMVEELRARGRSEIKVFGGGGGTITDQEIATLHARGVARIYSVEDGRRMGLTGMIRHMIEEATRPPATELPTLDDAFFQGEAAAVARVLTAVEALHHQAEQGGTEAAGRLAALRSDLARRGPEVRPPVLGITGVGGAGKSSLTDELLRRLLVTWPDRTVAVLSVDPTRRRSGGALLGDRIRMNALGDGRAFMRSMATRAANTAVPAAVRDALAVLQAAGFDLVILETAGIGQSGSEVVDLSDAALYVMTPEFGAPTQLEKIDMLDYADVVALNKADKRGAEDALKAVKKQMQRNKGAFDRRADTMPVFACTASRFGDAGTDALFAHLMTLLSDRGPTDWPVGELPKRAPGMDVLVPPRRVRYLSEIADAVRNYKHRGDEQVAVARRADGLRRALKALGDDVPDWAQAYDPDEVGEDALDEATHRLRALYNDAIHELDADSRSLLADVRALQTNYRAPENVYRVRGREIRVANHLTTLSGTEIPKVALPDSEDWGELLKWRWLENVPGQFPFTAGVFPFKRAGEDPTRMFAGEGHPERTNRRFHYLSKGQPAARLSTAFDSVTLYGRDPARRPDVYGKVGNSGVSVATLDDAKRLYSGFDLCAPSTSVSMTINGPAPMLLAMFFNTAVDQQVEARLKATGRWEAAQARIAELAPDVPGYRGELPPGHDGTGLGLLGVSGDQLLDAAEYAEVKAETLARVRGTVQADILKEEQAQNTCIFSTEIALRLMGDVQQYFIDKKVR